MRLANITSLSNVIDSHKPLLEHVVDVGQNLLQRCHTLPQHQRAWQVNVEAELTQLEAMWRELETAVRQQRERLDALNDTDPERQVIFMTNWFVYSHLLPVVPLNLQLRFVLSPLMPTLVIFILR